MTDIQTDARAYALAGGSVTAPQAGDCLGPVARALVDDFKAKYPAHANASEADLWAALEAMANALGSPSLEKFLGRGRIAADGSMTLDLVPMP